MGHIGAKALESLPKATKGCEDIHIGDIPKYKEEDACDTCIQAKLTSKISRDTPEKTDIYLEKVYSDICGPISPETPSKAKYFASLIDDATRWADIALLNSRD